MDTVIVVMQKDRETGFLDKELVSLNIDENENLIVNLFAQEADDNKILMYLKLSTERDVEDWEYSAILDYYDTDVFKDIVFEVNEVEEQYNPTWEVIFEYTSDIIDLEDKIVEILSVHRKELDDVYEIIKDKEGEYVE